jgi:sterol desaturase/sphingolipid hydroxylase (fatty acid hydroxylase superfamily)/transglutaminase-like putative cysteine protease
MNFTPAHLRVFVPFCGLALLLLLENTFPFRSRVDTRLRRYAINFFVQGTNGWILGVLLGGFIIAIYQSLELSQWGLLYHLSVPIWLNIVLSIILLDGASYFWHRAYHKFPFMWRMHQAHHSDLDVDVTTSGRFHLTEILWSTLFRIGVIALLGVSLEGVIIFEIVFGIVNQIEHANIHIPEPFESWLRKMFVTPDMHRVHHSRVIEQTNSNYATIFSWWDRFFGTYRFGMDQKSIVIGLREYPKREDVSLGRVLAMPFNSLRRSGGRANPFVLLAVFTLGVALFTGQITETMASKTGPFYDEREIKFTYVVRIPSAPLSGRQMDVWIPLAKTALGQEVLTRQIHSPVPYTISQDPDFSNDILHLDLKAPFEQAVEVEIAYQARLVGGEATSGRSIELEEGASSYLAPRGLITIDEEIRTRARRATEGKADEMTQARGIYESVIENMVYDKTEPGWGQGDTARACVVGKGNCTDFHSLFISMARSSKILARFKIGVTIPEGSSGEIPGYHCWAEFYDPQRGWLQVDASEAWKRPELKNQYFGALDGTRFMLSTGRDIQLIPKQKGSPVNILFYPYAELDGEIFSEVETEFHFVELSKEKEEVL